MAEHPVRRALCGALLVTAVALAPTPVVAAPAAPVSRQAAGEGPQLPVDPEADPDRARDRADEILERSEYHAPGPRDRNLVERVRDWIGDRLPDVERPEGDERVLDLGSVVVLVVVGGAAVTALVLVLRSARRTRRGTAVDADAEVEVTPLRTASGWVEEAERCERVGDHRGAVRARFRALTTDLADRGVVSDAPGRTAGEMRGDVAERAPALAPRFDAVADLFEAVWFGAAPAGAGETRAARHLAQQALDAAPRRSTALAGAAAEADG